MYPSSGDRFCILRSSVTINPAHGDGIAFDRSGRPRLVARVAPVSDIDPATIDAMYRLFSESYEDVDRQLFERDLMAKAHVIFVHDRAGYLRGFSTLVVWKIERSAGPIRMLFSGDTVIEPSFWGDRSFLIKWLETIGALYGEQPLVPFYWLLISKSPRTYRALPLFFRRFYPSTEDEEPLADLANDIGRIAFADRFDEARGVILAAPLTGRLSPPLAFVPPKDTRRRDVQFFVSRNPGFAAGDELVCLARIQPANIRTGIRRYFERGKARGSLS